MFGVAEGQAEHRQKAESKEKECQIMRMTYENMIDYIKALEATNDQLLIALKKCVELLASIPPPICDQPGWQEMIEDFEKLVRAVERAEGNKTLH